MKSGRLQRLHFPQSRPIARDHGAGGARKRDDGGPPGPTFPAQPATLTNWVILVVSFMALALDSLLLDLQSRLSQKCIKRDKIALFECCEFDFKGIV